MPLVFIATIGFQSLALASEREFTLHCEYLRTAEILKTFRQIAGHVDFNVTFKEVDGDIVMEGGTADFRARLQALKEAIDVPYSQPPTRWIKLRHGDVIHIADVVTKAFVETGPDDKTPIVAGNEMPLQVVPAVRTNELLVFGPEAVMEAAVELALLIDGMQKPVSRGCGDVGASLVHQ
ncbi:hypothetical protein [Luteolibacter marinus]|uniref:hypothetical protein n=1 Tax=Luteolibacter marinus TaxID=2776705 RepID=UPI0018680E5E|nr:hypothetical protein [Luteolibacter marinus]